MAGEPKQENLSSRICNGSKNLHYHDHNVTVTMWVPILAEEMQRSMAVYSAPDLKTLGKGIDEVGMTEEFQKMLAKASTLGTLDFWNGNSTLK